MEQGVTGSVSIRPATVDDEEVIRGLRAAVGWSPSETGIASMVAGRSLVFIAEVSSSPAASGALVLKTDDHQLANGSKVSLISNLIVSPAYQGHGLGTLLLHYLEDEARHYGRSHVTIGVDTTNVRARKLYEREGYERLKEKLEAWGPVVYLAKPLGEPART